MIIKVNYTVSDIYIGTTVSAVYIKVVYSGVSAGGGTWGTITGTLSDQTDLQNALDAKFDDPTGTTSQYLRGDGTLATFPTIPSITGLVPYTGATGAVNLGAFGITAASIIKSGGTSSQFLKADGSVDSSVYITGITSGNVTTALRFTPVPTTRTLTINGTTYDLSADRSWTIAAGVTGSGVANQLTYWNSTGIVTGSAGLVWDNVNTRLGVGNISPRVSLNISSVYNAASDQSGALSIDSYSGFSDYRGASTLILAKSSSSSLGTLLTTTDGQSLANITYQGVDSANNRQTTFIISSNQNGVAGTGFGSIKSDLNFYSFSKSTSNPIFHLKNNGDIGIGTTNITAITNYTQLAFNGVLGSFSEYRTNGANLFRLGSENNYAFINTATTGMSIRFSTDSSERMRLTSAGRLLLGTTSESTFLLDVNGTARVSGNSTFGTIGAGTGMFWDSTNNNLGIGTNAGSATDSISIIGSSSARKSIVVQNTNSAGNASFYFQNNRGSFASYGGLLHGGSTYSTTFFGVSSSDKTILLSDGANSTGLMIGTLVSANVIFGTNNSERARITAAGRLLLGTTNEGTDLLLVNGSAKIVGNFNAIGFAKFETSAFPDYSTYIGDGTYANGIGFCYGLNASGEGAINLGGYLGGITQFRDLRIGNGKGADIAKFFASTGNLVLQNGGTLTDVASAQLQISSTTKGFLPPRMTNAQILAIASPVNGLMAYNTTIDHICFYQGGSWVKINHSPM